jgi:hypothetical protein
MNLPNDHAAGTSWSVTIQDPVTGEEIVSGSHLAELEQTYIDSAVVDSWLHVSALTADMYWVRVGPLQISVHVGQAGEAKQIQVELEPNNLHEDCVIEFEEASYRKRVRSVSVYPEKY